MRRLPLLALLALSPTTLAQPLELSVDEFKMFRQYQNALQDPRVQKMKPEARRPAIAKDAGYKLKDLDRAIEKGEAAGDLKARCESAVKEGLAQTELAARVGKVEVDVSEPHAVAYVQWLNEALPQLEEEASLVGLETARGCPILSTLQLWAQDKGNPSARVFQALISREAASRINKERIKDFADTRYIKLFEKVKSVALGDDLSAAPGASAPAAK